MNCRNGSNVTETLSRRAGQRQSANMSYREVRRLCERMRALGCKQVVSMENFRTPNFELVAELLFWLLKRYDPGTTVQDDIDTQSERMRFLESVAQALYIKARLKLNIKRLYAADGKAVPELLKLTDLLFVASQQAHTDAEELTRNTDLALEALGHLETTMKAARVAASDIQLVGERIYAHLGKEADLLRNRQQILAHQADKVDVSRAIQEAIDQLVEEDAQLHVKMSQIDVQKTENGDKLRRKQTERERIEQRLLQMKNVKSPYQDELDSLLHELQTVNNMYVLKFRSLEYLDEELGKIRKDEDARIKAEELKLERLRQQIEDQDWKLMRGQLSVHEHDLANEFKDVDGESDESFPITEELGQSFQESMPSADPASGGANCRSLVARMDDAKGSHVNAIEAQVTGQVDQFAAMAKKMGFSEDDVDDDDGDADDGFINDDF
eukprot:jgi/Ulvmu1/5184/UM021_0201.1